jgi:hypothetical protein
MDTKSPIEKIDKNNRFENYRESLRSVLGQKKFKYQTTNYFCFIEFRLSGEFFLKK